MKLVLAGNHKQYKDYLLRNGLDEANAKYAFSATELHALRIEEILVTGTFWDREDATELYDLAKTRLFNQPLGS
jgi:hypothetical protein